MTQMKRKFNEIVHEIVSQILISELCFHICSSIEITPWKWNDFLPYYYNLNFSKWQNTLNSLLLSKEKNELSISNYVKEYEKIYPNKQMNNFKEKIEVIRSCFEDVDPLPWKRTLRNKFTAHIDSSCKHTDFTSGYLLPKVLPIYQEVINKLKIIFFEFNNYSIDDNHSNIREQSNFILNTLKVWN